MSTSQRSLPALVSRPSSLRATLPRVSTSSSRPARSRTTEPTGSFENDPNVTDKKFPGNPTLSYRSADPLRVVGETDDWTRLTAKALHAWRERLEELRTSERGEIIN